MKDLTQGNIYKTFFFFALPLLLSGLLSQSYHIIDTAIAGKFLGEAGIAAISSSSSFITLISSVLWGFSAGASIYFGILFGAKKFSELKNAIFSSFTILVFTCLALSVAAVIFKNQIFTFLKVDPSLFTEASKYFCVYIIGITIIVSNNFFISVFNALGLSKYPFYMSLISAVTNVCGNIFTLTVLKTGVIGVAFSTVFSALLVDIVFIIKLSAIYKNLGITTKNTFDKTGLPHVFSISIPVTFQQLIMYAVGVFISPSVNALGPSTTAAFSVANHVYEVCASMYQNSSKTVSTYSAQCIGAKKFGNLKKGVFAGFVQATLILLPIVLLIRYFARPICLFFFEDGYTGDALSYSVDFAKNYLVFVFLNIINNLFHSFWRGVTAKGNLLAGTIVGSVSRTALTLILIPIYEIKGVWIAWVLSWAIEAILNLILYFTGNWKKILAKYE